MITIIADQYLAQNAGRRYPFKDDTELPDWLPDSGVLDFRCTLYGVGAGMAPEAHLVNVAHVGDGSVGFTVDLSAGGVVVDTIRFLVPSDISGAPYTAYASGDRSTGALTVTKAAIPPDGGEGWQNPYVTDGLVAMWDGEWNAGGGVHDANATSWVDLVNGKSLPFVKHQNAATLVVSFGSNHLALSGAVANLSQSDDAYYRSLVTANPLTIELIHTLDTSVSSSRWYIAYNLWQNGTGGFLYCDGGIGGLDRSAYSGDMRLSTTPKNRTFVFSGSTKEAYLNGTLSKSTTNGSDTLDSNARLIGNTYNYNSSNFGYYGNIYAIRIYNRALTAAEIAANYAVDEERFNLP